MDNDLIPFFSIVIPTLNEEKYLPKLLQSLTNQTFQDFEIIHVDGHSDDKTVEKAAKFKSKLNLKTIVADKRQVSYQRNLGGEKAQGKWIIFMDADDYLKNYFLQGLKYQIDKNPDVDVFTTWLDVESYPAKHRPTVSMLNFGLELLSKFSPATFGALVGVRPNLFKKAKFNEKMNYSEDWEFVKEVIEAGGNYACWQEPRYSTSFRRFEKEGFIKLSRIFIEGQFKRLTNEDWKEDFDKYPMQGGSFYDEPSLSFFQKIESFLQNASKKQLKKAKEIWERIGLNNNTD